MRRLKVLVTGVNGQLGHDVMLELAKRGHECVGSGSAEEYRGVADSVAAMPYRQIELSEAEDVEKAFDELLPEAVIHCAAWTDVEKAEREENYPRVYAVNVQGSRNLAGACKRLGSKLLYISTDYVFDGKGSAPYDPDSRDYAPLNMYGRTKLAGELAIADSLEKYFIVRTSWLYGLNGGNFVKTVLRIGQKSEELRVVCDQIGTPTYSRDLARLLADMIETERYGCYHASNEGEYVSWYDFACEIYRQLGFKTRIIPVTTEEYGAVKAARPLNSRLDKSKLKRNGFDPLPDWKEALSRYLEELNAFYS